MLFSPARCAFDDVTLKQAIQFVQQAIVLSYHFARAFTASKARIQGRGCPSGLSVAREPWEPTVTEDRLPTSLESAGDCGLIKTMEAAFTSKPSLAMLGFDVKSGYDKDRS